MNGQPHQQKPDIDNCCKALMDLEGTNDGHVHMLNATKRWAEKGRIILYR
jgi:Holliday junction resolvase RusA-like endonuclease